MEWTDGNNPPDNELVDAKIRHCNKDLGLKDEVITGYMGEDGFYLHNGGELSFNWDIIAWRKHEN